MIHYTELRAAFITSMAMADRMLYRNDPRLTRLHELHDQLIAEQNLIDPEPEAPDQEKIDYYRHKRHELLRRYVSIEHDSPRKKTAMLASMGWDIYVVSSKLFDLTGNQIYNTVKA